MQVNKRYFEGLLVERGISLRKLARMMGLTHSQLSLTFSGDRRMQLNEAAQIADIFGVPLQQVIVNAGVPLAARTGKRCKVIGTMRGDGTIHTSQKGAVEHITYPDGLSSDTVAVQARTADSQLAWMDGWRFFIRSDQSDPAAFLGKFCMVKIKDGRTVMGTVRRGYHDDEYGLSGPFTSEGVEIEWVSLVALIMT